MLPCSGMQWGSLRITLPDAPMRGLVRPMVTPKLYVKTGCPWCEEVLEFLDAQDIPYEEITVTGDAEAMREMVELSGQNKAPTMDWDGEVLADFGVDELVPFLRERKVIS